MTHPLTLRSAFLIAAGFGSSIAMTAYANDGGGGALPDESTFTRNCEGAERSASMALNEAEKNLKAVQNRTATRKETDAAKKRVAVARQRLRDARAGKC